MAAASAVNLSSRPRLAGFVRLQHDSARDRWVLQAPERIFVLDETGKVIIDRCDGTASVETIVDALIAEYDAPREMIEHDVRAVLGLLAEKSFLILDDDSDAS